MRDLSLPLYQQIAETFRRRIALGELSPGDRLPTVRDTAHTWGCTPGTVNRAYAILAEEGLVASHRGKGTFVTPGPLPIRRTERSWAELIHHAEAFLLQALREGHEPTDVESALSVALARWHDLQTTAATPKDPPSIPATRLLRFSGSHDLAVEIMVRLYKDRPESPQLITHFCGSLGGLIALARGEADVAGVHLWDAESGEYNLPFVRRILPGQAMVLITLAHRQLGLVVPRGNPMGIHDISDLARREIRFANRQTGSGTRVWLESQLRSARVRPEQIPGFDREEPTHYGVARAIANDEANAGVGILAAARSQGLEFIPLTKERYDLVFPASAMEQDALQILLKLVRSPRLKDAIEPLGGYDTSESGREMRL